MAQDGQAVLHSDAPASGDVSKIDFSKIRFCTQRVAKAVKLPKPLPQGNFEGHKRGDNPPLERLVSIILCVRCTP